MTGGVEIWDIETGTVHKTSGEDVVVSIAFSPDDKTVAFTCEGQVVHLCDASTGEDIGNLSSNTTGTLSVAYSADGKWLASGGNNELLIWNVDSKSPYRRFKEEGASFVCTCFSPNGNYVAAASWIQPKALVWDVQADKLVKEIPFGSDVLCVAFSPDGESVAVAGRTDTVEVWDVQGWVKRYQLSANGSWLTWVAYSPDGKSLVAASPAGEIRFWRAATGEPTGSLAVDKGIRRAFFAPNGNGIVWASMDGTVEYWSATPVEEIPGLGSPPKE